ncbi:aspartate/glutamate racemase family protein [Consotaella aegiceratis]|uniref:aspartate/glutamate racemase family protein n=1 Tax=Consotaella aegiceratis TaxID=3097961 RepID=UPI002F3E563C
MRIAIVNPNATSSMTETIAAAARRVAAAGTEIVAITNEDGPASIEGHVDGALAVPGLLNRIVRAEAEGANAHIIACFDDTGLDAARSLARKPVVGIGEAGAHMASLVARRFAVVTTLDCAVTLQEENLAKSGLSGACCGVRSCEVPVLDLESDPEAAAKISEEIERAIRDDRAEAIVLGCAGMAEFAARLSQRHGLPVIDGVAAAVKLAEGLVAMGLTSSRRGGYAAPRPKARPFGLTNMPPSEP